VTDRFVRVVSHWKPKIPSEQTDPIEHQLIFDLLVNEYSKVLSPKTLRFGAYGSPKHAAYRPFALLEKKLIFSTAEEWEATCDIQFKEVRVGEYFSYADEKGEETYQIKELVTLG
jgi:hypothetical protein